MHQAHKSNNIINCKMNNLSIISFRFSYTCYKGNSIVAGQIMNCAENIQIFKDIYTFRLNCISVQKYRKNMNKTKR